MDVFSLMGKITINYTDAVKGLDKVSQSAEDAAESLDDVDKKSNNAGDSIEDSGNAAKNADSGFTVWKATLANLASTAITAVIQKCEQLAAKMVDLTETAVGNYANYEQLVGGVETLFGDSADTLIGYAENAYKTVQLSSNDYMDTATSFAASLIQGLGGDTEEAVRLTDVAITDMADNANKMGTDISSIQDAYQGFAKQNYTMLDNLKLGYGGTQTEMIRLINDSGILEEQIDSLDGITFDQMIQAIHEIQTEMGITGTSAEEAGTTISGSWNSVQAMFNNILTKVGGQLAPTIMTFLNQLQDWMDTIDWDAFAEDVGDAFGQLFAWIQDIDFTSFFQAGIEGIEGFLTWVSQIITKIPQVISFFQKWAPVIKAVVTALGTMVVITSVISMVTSLVGVIGALANPFGLVVAAITAAVSAIVYFWNTSETFRTVVTTIFETVKTSIATAFETVSTIVTNVVASVQTAWETMSQAIQNAMSTVQTVLSTAWATIQNIVQVALLFIQELISAAAALLMVPWQFIWENFKTYILGAWEIIKSTVSAALDVISSVIGAAWNAISSVTTTVWTVIQTLISTIWNSISSVISTVVGTIQSVISIAWNTISSVVSTVLGTIQTKVSTIWNSIKTTVSTVVNSIRTTISTVFNSIKSTINSILDPIKTKFSTVWNGIKTTVSTAINGVKSTISTGLNAAKSTITSILDSIKSKFSTIFNTCKTTVSNAINKIKGFFNFSWSLPKLKMPHFSITGSFSINPPSVPHFSISWYKKAMEDGMIMNSPTIFGYDAKSNQFLAGGEAGSETVVGTNSLMGMIQAAVNAQKDNTLAYVEQLVYLLQQYLPGMANMQLVTDTGALIGEISPALVKNVKTEIGREQRNQRAARGI